MLISPKQVTHGPTRSPALSTRPPHLGRSTTGRRSEADTRAPARRAAPAPTAAPGRPSRPRHAPGHGCRSLPPRRPGLPGRPAWACRGLPQRVPDHPLLGPERSHPPDHRGRGRRAPVARHAGLAIRLARAVNHAIGRRGAVWGDRYHARALATPRAVRHALVYVLMNLLAARVGPPPSLSRSWMTACLPRTVRAEHWLRAVPLRN